MMDYFTDHYIFITVGSVLLLLLVMQIGFGRRRGKRGRYIGDVSEYDLKSIRTLEKTYRFDFEHERVEIPFSFGSAEEIVETSLSDENSISISSSFVIDLMERISYIPRKYSVDLLFSFETLNGFSCKSLIDALLDRLEEYYIRAVKASRKNYFKALAFIILCITISIVATVPVNFGYTSSVGTVYSQIIALLLTNFAVLLLSQATGTILLLSDKTGVDDLALYHKLNRIRYVDEQKWTVSLEKEDIFRYWPHFKRRERLSHILLMFSNAYVFTIFVVESTSYITEKIDLSPHELTLLAIEWVLILFITYSNTAFYFDNRTISKHAFKISFSYVIILVAYNINHFIYIRKNAIPFDYDDFRFTYLMIAVLMSVCIHTVQRERKKRVDHLMQDIRS